MNLKGTYHPFDKTILTKEARERLYNLATPTKMVKMYTKKDFWIDNIDFIFGAYSWSFYGPARQHLHKDIFNENLDYFTGHIIGIYSSDDVCPNSEWRYDIKSILLYSEGIKGIVPSLIDDEFLTDLKARYHVLSSTNKTIDWFIMNKLNCSPQFITNYDFIQHVR
jgi:hypothetical protein